MHNSDTSAKKIIALAYLHRYGWTLSILAGVYLPPAIQRWTQAICFLGYAIWSFVGYKCKWKHIYCSYQYEPNQKMTPDSICWDNVKNVVAYGVPVLYFVLALVCIFLQVVDL